MTQTFTDIDGMAHAFDRGFVSYTDGAKRKLPGVPTAILANESAVSAASAEAMVLGALEQSMADVALSITGYAGPGAPDDEPGLVYFGLCRRLHAPRVEERHFGDIGRTGVRIECLRTALSLLATILNRRPSGPEPRTQRYAAASVEDVASAGEPP